MSPKLLAIVITVVFSWLVIEHPCAAVRNVDSSSNGNRRFYARPMFPSRYSPVDMIAEDEDAMELNKRQLTDDYGHMRFGKRDQFDDYGHMRFGRNHD